MKLINEIDNLLEGSDLKNAQAILKMAIKSKSDAAGDLATDFADDIKGGADFKKKLNALIDRLNGVADARPDPKLNKLISDIEDKFL